MSDNERDDNFFFLFPLLLLSPTPHLQYSDSHTHTHTHISTHLSFALFMIYTALCQANAGYTGSDGWSWYTLFLFLLSFLFSRSDFRFLHDTQYCMACNDLPTRWYTRVFLFVLYFGAPNSHAHRYLLLQVALDRSAGLAICIRFGMEARWRENHVDIWF